MNEVTIKHGAVIQHFKVFISIKYIIKGPHQLCRLCAVITFLRLKLVKMTLTRELIVNDKLIDLYEINFWTLHI